MDREEDAPCKATALMQGKKELSLSEILPSQEASTLEQEAACQSLFQEVPHVMSLYFRMQAGMCRGV